MSSILFIDPCCPKPYDHSTLYTQSQGGTESTVTRVAEGLTDRGHLVVVEQHNREQDEWGPSGTRYTRENSELDHQDHVVVLRLPKELSKARQTYPKAKLHLWAHDLYSEEHAKEVLDVMKETDTTSLICVSNFHKQQILGSMADLDFFGQGKIKVLYPPLDPTIGPDSPPNYNPHQLAWFSSPHKGLKQALELFSFLRTKDDRFTFVVHNPGYFDSYAGVLPPGVVIKPKGSFYDAIKTVKGSLCVFYPNMVFPETFGLVFSEANAVGTPVLTHPLGSAQEVLDHPHETLPCHQVNSVVDRILHWSKGNRPTVRTKPQFHLNRVLTSWENLFNEG